jgi:hypothetical protein
LRIQISKALISAGYVQPKFGGNKAVFQDPGSMFAKDRECYMRYMRPLFFPDFYGFGDLR